MILNCEAFEVCYVMLSSRSQIRITNKIVGDASVPRDFHSIKSWKH